MVECTICGEKDFVIEDGLYYCTQCNTQSQHAVEEELEDDIDGINLFSGYGKRIKRSTHASKLLEKEEEAEKRGRYWQTFEAWTVIIRKQVDALISLGADAKLKGIVLRLWMLYLNKLGIAFTNEESAVLPLFTVDRYRDAAIFDEVPKRSAWKKKPTEEEQAALLDELDKHEFYPEDYPLPLAADGEEPGVAENRMYRKARKGKRFWLSPKLMMKSKTLAFCYLGLMYQRSTLTMSDLIQWVKEGKVPYFQVLDLLPPDMKFAENDCLGFTTENSHGMLSILKMHRLCGQLVSFLRLTDLPSPDIPRLCSLFIVQLDLPTKLHAFVRTLWSRVPGDLQPVHNCFLKLLPEAGFDNLNLYMTTESELIAMSLIVLVLKMLFGLDGKREQKLADEAAKLKRNNLCQEPFVLIDWMRHMQKKQHSAVQPFYTASPKDINHVVDVEHYVQNCTAVFQTYSTSRNRKNVMPRHVSYRDENRSDMQKPVWELADYLSYRAEGQCLQDSVASFQPDESLANFLGTSQAPQPTVNAQSFAVRSHEEYKNFSLNYILHPSPVRNNTIDEAEELHELPDKTASAPSFKAIGEEFSTESQPMSYQWLLCLCARLTGWTHLELHRYVRVLQLLLLKPAMDNSDQTLLDGFKSRFFLPILEYSSSSESDSDEESSISS